MTVAAALSAPVTDRALAAAVRRAGEPGGIRFTERQLYYELCRVTHPLHRVPRRLPLTLAPAVRYARFAEALRRRGATPGLLGGPRSGPTHGPTHEPGCGAEAGAPYGERPAPPSDLYDYGLPRLLVCQSAAVARMLIANDVHLEAACPVLASAELPLAPRLLAGLERADGATVHVLHDASPTGLALPGRVRDHLGATARFRVCALGLVPRHAASLHLTAGRGPAPPDSVLAGLPSGLERRERDWLADGRFAEVEAVAPAHLLRTLLRLLRGPRQVSPSVWTGLRDLRTAGFMTWPTT